MFDFYLLFLVAGMVFGYGIMTIWLTYFFNWRRWSKNNITIYSISKIILWALVSIYIATLITDPDIANRRLHMVAGWMMIAYVYYRSAKDSNIKIKWLQYIIWGLCICCFAWVCNELCESLLQYNTNLIFSTSIQDTRRDLWSNTIGSSIVLILTHKSISSV